jgi:hypothetical protein
MCDNGFIQTIRCPNCMAEILDYYSEKYHGVRGRCPICDTDIPLE